MMQAIPLPRDRRPVRIDTIKGYKMQRRFWAALAAVMTAGVLAVATPAAASAPPSCGTPWWPTDGATTVTVVGNRVTLDLTLVLHGTNTPGTQLYAAKCVAPYAKLLFTVTNAGAAGGTYAYDTTLPYGAGTAPQYKPILASPTLTAGTLAVTTSALAGEVTYRLTVSWTKTSAGTSVFNLFYYAFRGPASQFEKARCPQGVLNVACQFTVDSRPLYSVPQQLTPGVYTLVG